VAPLQRAMLSKAWMRRNCCRMATAHLRRTHPTFAQSKLPSAHLRRLRFVYGAQAVADTVGGVVLAMLATVTVMQFFN
jgi:hypothetical protein